MKQLALQYYLGNNWSVIPVGNDKRPVIKSWAKFQTERADETQINKWWTEKPEANIGIVTGAISGITVVDLDCGKTDGKVTPLETFPETFTVQTPSGGFHLIYQYDESIKQTANTYTQFPHTDIRNNGGYIVGAGSKTPNGEYKIIKDIAIAPFPTALFIGTDTPPQKKSRLNLKDVVSIVEGDGRNPALTALIGSLIAKTPRQKWDDEVFVVAVEVNKTYHPPLSHTELTTIYESICGKELRKGQGGGTDDENSLVAQFKNNFKKGTYALAMHIVAKYNIITIGEVEREVYIYDSGMYRRAENEIIYPEVQRILKEEVNKSAKLEVFHKIVDVTYKRREVFSSTPVNFIPLRNGVYDIDTGKLLPHSPDYKFKFQFPITYNADSKCPNMHQFMRDILNEDQKATIEEWLGYYFYRIYAFKKAVIFVGEGDTGKTTLLETINSLLGRENVASVSLHKLTGEKFSSFDMYEKHGNLVDELSAKDISDTGNFKIATGGGSITGEEKFGNRFSFLNFAKLTFACNKIPDVKDFNDDAYFNRWMVIRFEKTIAKDKMIPNFMAKLTTEEEKSGLFNMAMVGLKRLLENKKFTYSSSAIDTKLEMMRDGSSIAQFASEGVRQENGAEITKEALYDVYMEFCTRLELSTETMDLFGKKFKNYVDYATEKSMAGISQAGKLARVRGWLNVAIVKTEKEIKLDLKAEEDMKALAGKDDDGFGDFKESEMTN